MGSVSDVPSRTSESDIPSSEYDVPSSQSDGPSSSSTSKSDGEPDPKRAKLDEVVEEDEEECEGWDTWGEKEHLVYTPKSINVENALPDDIAYFQFLEDHVRKNKGFDISARSPLYDIFYLLLPHDAPIPEELKDIADFPRIDPRYYDRALQVVYALAKSAVDVQNEKMGSKLEFVKVLKAYTFRGRSGSYYYITLVALDKCTGDYRKCQTRVLASCCMLIPTIPYGVCSFWVRGKVDAAGAAKRDFSQNA